MGVLDQNAVVLDMEALSHVADREVHAKAKSSLSLKFLRTLSRKGSQGGERKSSSEREAADTHSKGGQGGVCTGEKCADLSMVGPTTMDQSTAMDEIICRRYSRCNSSVNKLRIDPRRVLLFFATLSSMGTIILIYFTLSIANVNRDGAQTQ